MSPARLIFAALARSDLAEAAELARTHRAELEAHAPQVLRALLPRLGLDIAVEAPPEAPTPPPLPLPSLAPHEATIADRERLLRFAQLVDATRAARSAGDYERAYELAREGSELALRLEPHERARIARVLPALLIEWSRDIRGSFDFTDRHALLDRAYAWAMSAGDPRAAATAAAELAADRAFTGRSGEAELWLRRARTLAAAARIPLPLRAGLAEALLCDLRLELPEAVRILERLVPPGTPPVVGTARITALRLMWSAQLPHADLRALAAELAALTAAVQLPPFTQIYVRLSQARLHLIAGRPERALMLLDTRDAGDLRPLLDVYRAAAHLMRGDFHAAEVDATETPDAVDRWPRIRAEKGVLAALARLNLGDREGAARRFRDAVALAEVHSAPVAFTVIPPAELERLTTATYGDEPPEVVSKVTRSRVIATSPGPLTGRLTQREARLLRTLIAHPTLRVAELAELLEVSPNTIKTQLSALYRKAGVSGRGQLIRAARARLGH